MIKKQTLYTILYFFIFFTSLLSYEIHLFPYYKYFQIAIALLILLLFFIILKYENILKKQVKKIISKQYYLLIMFVLMISNTIIGYIIFKYNNLFSIINTIIICICSLFEFYYFPAICQKNNNILETKVTNTFINISFILSLISIMIKINGNKFMGYGLVNARVSSIFYDPNFAAMIFGIAFIISLKKENFKKMIYKIIICSCIGLAILLSGSRGTLLSLIFSTFIFLLIFKNINVSKKILLLFSFGIIAFILVIYLYSIDFFRVYQGANHRFDMIIFAIGFIFKSPVFGYGYESVANILRSNGFTNASTHNSFIDYALCYGLINFLLYIILIVSILKKSMKNKKPKNEKYILVTLFAIINSNTILYSFGGVGLSSFLYTYFLGMLNYKIISSTIEEEKL